MINKHSELMFSLSGVYDTLGVMDASRKKLLQTFFPWYLQCKAITSIAITYAAKTVTVFKIQTWKLSYVSSKHTYVIPIQ